MKNAMNGHPVFLTDRNSGLKSLYCLCRNRRYSDAHRLIAVLGPHKFKGIAQAIAGLAVGAELDRGRFKAPAPAFLFLPAQMPRPNEDKGRGYARRRHRNIRRQLRPWNHQKIGRLGVGPLAKNKRALAGDKKMPDDPQVVGLFFVPAVLGVKEGSGRPRSAISSGRSVRFSTETVQRRASATLKGRFDFDLAGGLATLPPRRGAAASPGQFRRHS